MTSPWAVERAGRVRDPKGRLGLGVLVLLLGLVAGSSRTGAAEGANDRAGLRLESEFRHPPEPARPWVYWYWMYGAVSGAGITADLEAMKQAGLVGAYLMPVRGVPNPPLFQPSAQQLSPEWWALVRHAFSEADRLGLKLAMHACDGWSAAGGPWITPELSMQKLTWSSVRVEGGRPFEGELPTPPMNEGYYRDVGVFAFPSPDGQDGGASPGDPVVTTDKPGTDAGFLGDPGNRRTFVSDGPCWVQFAFRKPFTCRSIVIRPGGGNYEANRLLVSVSDDGVAFRPVMRLVPPRHGWQDDDADVTHSLPATHARFFRFSYDPEGSEPGAEDLDSAKWITGLRLQGIDLSGTARINQFEGKNGEVWRVGAPTTSATAPDSECVPLARIVDVTGNADSRGRLAWVPPPGRWTILRIGHTSSGHRNEKGGGGAGLECDKLNAGAAKVQFDHWFGEAIRQAGPALAGRVLKIFHVDSWECGSQNWTADFREEFTRRRGYDPLPWLPAMTGLPVQSADLSERFLHDVRQTIAELLADRFYATMEGLARGAGCSFSAECVAPTMICDGMLHYREVDLPQGEFWLRSPTNDKLTDILDAVSGARIYDKRIVQAEAFTELQIGWDEHPALLKALADRNYCLGINRFVFHVFTENPWLDRRPGMTLDGVGSFFQRDQTWWRPGRAWIDYTRRCQALLQEGRPVADIAVFTGEEIPRRALIPAQLVSSLPGLFGADIVAREARRIANRGVPITESPSGNFHTAISDPGDWVDALRGYAYDSINPDALLRLATVRDGRIVLPGGASYAVLVIPASRPMSPDASAMTPEVAGRLRELVTAGATVILCERPGHSPSLRDFPASDAFVRRVGAEFWPEPVAGQEGVPSVRPLGRGRVVTGPYREDSLAGLGIERDFAFREALAVPAAAGWTGRIGWTHREAAGTDLYFISNPAAAPCSLEVSLRVSGRRPELWNPVTGGLRAADSWRVEAGRTILPVSLPPNGSAFIVLRSPALSPSLDGGADKEANSDANRRADGIESTELPLQTGSWKVSFDPGLGGPAQPVAFDHLESWSAREEPGIRHYSGTAAYSTSFRWQGRPAPSGRVWLDLGRVANLAEVTLNGVDCGIAWTEPYRLDVTAALRTGANDLKVSVTNTWANRLMGDHDLPPAQRITYAVNAPYRLGNKPLLDAGLLGPVTMVAESMEQDGQRKLGGNQDRPGTGISVPEMKAVYAEAGTPFKYGIVVHPPSGAFVDGARVFRHEGRWYMTYVITQAKAGYETMLAVSDNLLDWKPLGKVLPFEAGGWDRWQANGAAALIDPEWGGSSEVQPFGEKYWMTYYGGALQGYETDPLSIGIAWTANPGLAVPWTRYEGNPVLAPGQPASRPFESVTMFKSEAIWDRSGSLGHPFVMFYNAKQRGPSIERIGMAVSDDMLHWSRFGAGPVIDNGGGISGNPQIVRMGGLWVMFYFGAGWQKPGPAAFDTFACSRDLAHWTQWRGPNLLSPSEPWDATYAHKPWLLKHDGVVYHFYCAVGSEGRAIALATSRDLRATPAQ